MNVTRVLILLFHVEVMHMRNETHMVGFLSLWGPSADIRVKSAPNPKLNPSDNTKIIKADIWSSNGYKNMRGHTHPHTTTRLVYMQKKMLKKHFFHAKKSPRFIYVHIYKYSWVLSLKWINDSKAQKSCAEHAGSPWRRCNLLFIVRHFFFSLFELSCYFPAHKWRH